MRVRRRIRIALVDLVTRDVDIIAAPTRATVAYPVGPKFEDIYKGISGGPSLIGGANAAGIPAISIPNGFGENGLPTAAQLIAGPFREGWLVSVAEEIQKHSDFHLRKPPQFA
jgi:aspartyl-tRNA(Asn)/glutamyl-tRNA(Gln) amidotransferase subunit A